MDSEMDAALLSKADLDGGSVAAPRLMEKANLAMRWPMLVLICFALIGDFYCYDNPAALKTQLHARFSNQMGDSEFENKFQVGI